MNTALKQRLIGAAVLVALAVIFVPMLLDGSGTRDEGYEIEIPDRPEIRETEDERDSLEPVPESEADPPEAVSEVEPSEDLPEDAVAEAPPDEEERPDAARADEDEPDEADEHAATDAPIGAWAVQTGGFTRQDYARAQRDLLREADYEAFLSEFESDGTRIWRVRVGPVATEQEARALLEELESEQDLEAILVSHP